MGHSKLRTPRAGLPARFTASRLTAHSKLTFADPAPVHATDLTVVIAPVNLFSHDGKSLFDVLSGSDFQEKPIEGTSTWASNWQEAGTGWPR